MRLLDKFPSYEYLLRGAVSTFGRFPFALLSAILGTVVAISLAESETVAGELVLQKLLMAAALGLPLFISLAVYGERQRWTKIIRIAFQAIGIIPLAVYYFSLPEDVSGQAIDIVRFLLLNIGLHFFVAFSPFIGKARIDRFWQYNKSLFLRFLMAALYSGVMYIGLTIALAAADHLFGFEVKEVRYFQLWIVIAGIFNSWIFLAGVPRNMDDLNTPDDYPKGLKLFTQYILLPLVVLYFVILITYEGKIIFTWNWPKGWVSHLVLWYSVVGILSMLLLYPLRDKTGNRWIQVFSKWFFRALIPLVAMLIFAIVRRISDYGITENRYFVIAMAVGLSIAVIYFVFGKRKDIRIIPIILCCLAFISAYGPWSAFSVSKNNQMNRLEKILIKNNLLIDGSITQASDELKYEDQKEISSIINYLLEWHGIETFSGWLADSTINSLDSVSRYSQREEITKLMGFEYGSRRQKPDYDEYFRLNSNHDALLLISDYDYLIDINVMNLLHLEQANEIGDDSCFIRYDQKQAILEVRLKSFSNKLELDLSVPVTELVESGYRSNVPVDKMSFMISNADFSAKVVLRSIFGVYKENEPSEVNSIGGFLLIQKH